MMGSEYSRDDYPTTASWETLSVVIINIKIKAKTHTHIYIYTYIYIHMYIYIHICELIIYRYMPYLH